MTATNAVFETYRERLAEAAGKGGGALVDLIRGTGDVRERLALYTSARRVLGADADLLGRLDTACTVVSAGTAEIEDLLAAGTDVAHRLALLRALHILNFNLAADLCDCWPGDETPRERRHHEAGLRAAEYLLSGTFGDSIPVRGRANDFWARGMHQLSLGDTPAALDSWNQAVGLAKQAAAGPDAAGRDAEEQRTLCRGYMAIAAWLTSAGDRADAATAYREAAEFFAADPEDDEARFNLGQLEKVRARYAPGLPA